MPQGAYAPLQGVAEVREIDTAAGRDALVANLREAQGLVSFLTDRVDAALLDHGPALRVVANYAVGVNNIDLEAAAARGLWVTNTPGVLTEATAELTLGALIALLRRLGEGERELRAGRFHGWTPTYLVGEGLTGKRLGIVGFGRIGRAVARRAEALGMSIVWCERPSAAGHEPGQLSFEALLETSDVVSLHVPLAPETHHLLGPAALARMRPGAYLVNTSRGHVVDEAAVAEALHAGRLAGAALDVYEDEPRVHPRLLDAPNALLLPHLGSNTREARLAMGLLASRNVVAVLRGEAPPTPVVTPGARA